MGNPEVPLDPEVVFRTLRSIGNPEVPLNPENPEVSLDPEVVFRTLRSFWDPEVDWEPEVPLDPERFLQTLRSLLGPRVIKNLEVYLFQVLKKFVQDPETAWGPVRPLPVPIGISHSTVRKLATIRLETQVPDLRCFPRLEKKKFMYCSLHVAVVLTSILKLIRTIPALSLIPIVIVAPCTNSEFEYSTLRLRKSLESFYLSFLPGVKDRSRGRSRSFVVGVGEITCVVWLTGVVSSQHAYSGQDTASLFLISSYGWTVLEPGGESFYQMVDRGLYEYFQVSPSDIGLGGDGLAGASGSFDIRQQDTWSLDLKVRALDLLPCRLALFLTPSLGISVSYNLSRGAALETWGGTDPEFPREFVVGEGP
ncbi:hypothetical protein DY000_02042910 [Brassica cretica]|uniref:Uncharacterized protein n=1 Tax=Brassica cretica TaxID=69181 RepID=A0ABQ7BC72_BRACR|nr:hypothetical protein DY000_02042910 [Brassica cretica]